VLPTCLPGQHRSSGTMPSIACGRPAFAPNSTDAWREFMRREGGGSDACWSRGTKDRLVYNFRIARGDPHPLNNNSNGAKSAITGIFDDPSDIKYKSMKADPTKADNQGGGDAGVVPVWREGHKVLTHRNQAGWTPRGFDASHVDGILAAPDRAEALSSLAHYTGVLGTALPGTPRNRGTRAVAASMGLTDPRVPQGPLGSTRGPKGGSWTNKNDYRAGVP